MQQSITDHPYEAVWQAGRSAGVSPTALLLLLILARECILEPAGGWLSKRALAIHAGLHPNTVMSHLQALHEAGLVVRRIPTDTTGAPLPHVYHLSSPMAASLSAASHEL